MRDRARQCVFAQGRQNFMAVTFVLPEILTNKVLVLIKKVVSFLVFLGDIFLGFCIFSIMRQGTKLKFGINDANIPSNDHLKFHGYSFCTSRDINLGSG